MFKCPLKQQVSSRPSSLSRAELSSPGLAGAVPDQAKVILPTGGRGAVWVQSTWLVLWCLGFSRLGLGLCLLELRNLMEFVSCFCLFKLSRCHRLATNNRPGKKAHDCHIALGFVIQSQIASSSSIQLFWNAWLVMGFDPKASTEGKKQKTPGLVDFVIILVPTSKHSCFWCAFARGFLMYLGGFFTKSLPLPVPLADLRAENAWGPAAVSLANAKVCAQGRPCRYHQDNIGTKHPEIPANQTPLLRIWWHSNGTSNFGNNSESSMHA